MRSASIMLASPQSTWKYITWIKWYEAYRYNKNKFCTKQRVKSNLYAIINLTIQKICWSSCCLVEYKPWPWVDENWEFVIAPLKTQHKCFCKHYHTSIGNKKHSMKLQTINKLIIYREGISQNISGNQQLHIYYQRFYISMPFQLVVKKKRKYITINLAKNRYLSIKSISFGSLR